MWGTCAGMILLAKRLDETGIPALEAMDISVRRNAFGRQVDSFEADLSIPALGDVRSTPSSSAPPSSRTSAPRSMSLPACRRNPGGCPEVGCWRRPFIPNSRRLRVQRYFLEEVLGRR